jgi:hypothetical protein
MDYCAKLSHTIDWEGYTHRMIEVCQKLLLWRSLANSKSATFAVSTGLNFQRGIGRWPEELANLRECSFGVSANLAFPYDMDAPPEVFQ